MRTTALLASVTALPPAIMGARVRAQPDINTIIAGISTAVTEMRADNNARLNVMEDSIARRAAMDTLNGTGAGGTPAPLIPADADYSRTFATYSRHGLGEDNLRAANGSGDRARVLAAMSEGSNPDGGYLAPTEWDRRVQQAQVPLSPIRGLAQVRSTSVGAYSTLWNSNQWGSGWVGETASRPATSTTGLSSLVFASGEIYANIAATQRLLDDAQIDFSAWMTDQISTEFTKQEGIAFVAGTGTNMPTGFLQYTPGGTADFGVANANGGSSNALAHPGGNLDVVASGAAGAIAGPDNLVDFMYGLASPYRQNSTWVMNSLTAATISKMKDGQGRYIWQEGILVGQPATLLGRPVAIDEHMPAIAAGNLAIAFGDFRSGYLINDRLGLRVLRDPYTNKPFVMFYTTKRVGAGVLDPRAIRVMKISAS